MPVIQFPGMQKDVFGGPAGSTEQALMQFIQGQQQLAAKKKREEQEALLAGLLGGEGQDPGTMPGMDPNIAVNTPVDRNATPTMEDYAKRAQSILSNPNLDIKQKIAGVGMQKAMQELLPVAPKEKEIKIEWWQKDGTPGKPIFARSVAEANQVTEQLDAAGVQWKAPEKPDKGFAPPEIVQLQQYQAQFKPDSPQYKQIQARINKLTREGGDGEGSDKDTVEIGGKPYTLNTLRSYYSQIFGVAPPDKVEESVLLLEALGNTEQAAKLRAKQAEAIPLDKAIEQWRAQGYISGLGPLRGKPMTPEAVNAAAGSTPVSDKEDRMRPPPLPVKEPTFTPKAPQSPEERKALKKSYLRQIGWDGKKKPTPEEQQKAAAKMQADGLIQ